MIRRRASLFVLLLALAAVLGPPVPARADGEAAPAKAGVKAPRFASLRAAEVNLRTGPGVRYPVDWVLTYRGMPVEVTGAFDTWRRVRDWQGAEGWVHQSMLSTRRTVIVRANLAALRREPAPEAPVVARVERKVLGRLLACRDAWCRVEVSGLRGWMRREALFGVAPDEKVD